MKKKKGLAEAVTRLETALDALNALAVALGAEPAALLPPSPPAPLPTTKNKSVVRRGGRNHG